MTNIIEGMNTDTITLSDTFGMEASRQLADHYKGLVSGN